MLRIFRRGLPWLKWIFVIVCITFVGFFGANWWSQVGGQGGGERGRSAALVINGESVSLLQMRDATVDLERRYRQMFGAQFEQIRKQLDLEGQAKEQVIQRTLVLQDAKRLGLSVSDDELTASIQAIPAFQNGGKFIGYEAYKNLLHNNNQTPENFEARFEEDLLVSRWQGLLGLAVAVSDKDVDTEYRRRHEKVTFDYVVLPYAAEDKQAANPSDAELSAWYAGHRDRFKEGEGRRAVYVVFDDKTLADKVQITDDEISKYYDAHQDQFTRPEQRRARHVLIEAKPDADPATIEAARQKAADVLRQAKSGADFAKLAQQYSDDPGSKTKGGDLGWFGRGQMVPAFEQAAFSLSPGTLSDLVRTDFGFHVIKVEEARPATKQALAEVKEQIRGQLRFPRLKDAAQQAAGDFVAKLKGGEDFRAAAKAANLELRDTGVVTRASVVPGIGAAPQMVEAIFALAKGKASDVVALPRGSAVLMVQDVLPDYVPPFETRRDRVAADYRQERSHERARQSLARAVSAAGNDLSAAAKALKVDLKRTTPAYLRGTDIPGAGASPAVDEKVFAASPGTVLGPLETAQGVIALRVVSKEEPDRAQFAQESEQIKDSLRQGRAQRVVQERIDALRKASSIQDNMPKSPTARG